ncbi:MAG TPA: DNA integrity scanning diadenylate cyclase DisA [Acidimicrobiia bacterium]|nr:DNA integrity scanning diadenylate cyclase DisA [Acidimicrobiia bacterium]
MPAAESSLLEMLARVAPGTPLRRALERIIQQGSGALIVLGDGPAVASISSGGFRLEGSTFSAPRLAELAKMDGGIVIDDDWNRILAANVHFLPDAGIPTEETGSRHRTAERLALQTGKPVVAVSEGRHLATLFHNGEKIELARPNVLTARANQDLQTLERLRRRLDSADERLTVQEVTGLATFRAVVGVLQQGELVRRIGRQIEHQTVSLGGEARLIRVQLSELMRGVEYLLRSTLSDYLLPRRDRMISESLEALTNLDDQDLDDLGMVAKAVGFPDLDDGAQPRGIRLLAKVGRIPEAVREVLLAHFRTLDALLAATAKELEEVEGIGTTRATLLRRYFDRLRASAATWEPESD